MDAIRLAKNHKAQDVLTSGRNGDEGIGQAHRMQGGWEDMRQGSLTDGERNA